ncbi:hypothetical protein [Chloroflexus sp.]|uniref:hypothetical protein n=1 Tax=Chloroflexus sp. TaxID=1904827 RepID=UPI00404992E8
MQLLSEQVFEHFTCVYDHVKASYEELRQSAAKKLRHPSTSIKWHFFLTILAVFLSWFFIFNPIIFTNHLSLETLFSLLIRGVGFGVWVFIVALVGNRIYRYSDHKPFLLLTGSILILTALPIIFGTISHALITQTIDLSATIKAYVGWSIISLSIWSFLFGICFIIGNIPLIIFLIFSSINNHKEDRLIPSYMHITRYATKNVLTNTVCKEFTANDWQNIEQVNRWKFDGINGRLQAFSFGISGLGFLSVFALLFSADEIRLLHNQFWELIAKLLGLPSEPETGIQLFTILVGIVVLLALSYFYRAYTELRYLETVGIICSLAQDRDRLMVNSISKDRQETADMQKP